MKNLITLFLACLIAISAISQSFRFTDNFDCLNKNVIDYSGEPGYAFAFIQNDEIVYTITNGLSDVEAGQAITLKTPFYVASVSKTFTSTGILMLAEKGKLHLNDRVNKYLKTLPQYMDGVTIMNLLTHSSGIPEYTKSSFEIRTNEDVFHVLNTSDSLSFNPGSKFSYNNSGFVLLSEIIEKVSGKTYEEFIREKMLKPLNMNDTYFANEIDKVPRALGYTKSDSKGVFMKSDTEGYEVVGSTGMYSTVNDMAKWLTAFSSSRIITPKMKNMMFTYPTSSKDKLGYMNMGWFNETMGKSNEKVSGLKQDGMIGVSRGFRAYIIKYRDHNMGYIVLSNRGDLPHEIMGYQLAECLFEKL